MLQVNVANHCLNLVILECAGLSLLTDAGFIVSVFNMCIFGSVRSSRNAYLIRLSVSEPKILRLVS